MRPRKRGEAPLVVVQRPAPSTGRLHWLWQCRLCLSLGLDCGARHWATVEAERHLRERHTCPSCRAYGRVAPACPVCLGRGWEA